MKKWRWYYIVYIFALIFLMYFSSLGVRYSILYSQYRKDTRKDLDAHIIEVSELLGMVNDLLLLTALPDDIHIADISISVKPGYEFLACSFEASDGAKSIKIGVSGLNLDNYTHDSDFTYKQLKLSTYHNVSGDTLMNYETKYANFYVMGNNAISKEVLEDILMEYVQYLIDNRISE